MAKKKDIIDLENERYGLFMNEQSYNLEIEYGRNYLETDNVQEVTIYRINVTKTKKHALYGQSKAQDKVFFTPVKLKVMATVEPSKQMYYGENKGGITRDDSGNLTFGIYLKELEEKNTEINRGDYVMYNQSGSKARYYEVESANNVTDTTDKTIGGFKSYWKKIIAVPVKEDVVPFLNETHGD